MTTFSVVTPSFQQCAWLRLAAASVADQITEGISVEHVVQEAGSTDGTDEFLTAHPEIRAVIEKDSGMYDAINRGLRRAGGEILAYLNCDEQYLPGALARVADFFQKHPDVDLLFAGWVVVDGEGRYVCSRKTLPPLIAHTRVCHLSAFTCSMFFRRRVLDQNGLFFDAGWKAVGDAEWVVRCIEAGLKIAAIPEMTSVFTDTGKNLGETAESTAERNRLWQSAKWWQRLLVPLIAAHHRGRRWLAGIYHQEPFDYGIYTSRNPGKRSIFHVSRPTTFWKKRFTLFR